MSFPQVILEWVENKIKIATRKKGYINDRSWK